MSKHKVLENDPGWGEFFLTAYKTWDKSAALQAEFSGMRHAYIGWCRSEVHEKGFNNAKESLLALAPDVTTAVASSTQEKEASVNTSPINQSTAELGVSVQQRGTEDVAMRSYLSRGKGRLIKSGEPRK